MQGLWLPQQREGVSDMCGTDELGERESEGLGW